jgi:hypothetical protein
LLIVFRINGRIDERLIIGKKKPNSFVLEIFRKMQIFE